MDTAKGVLIRPARPADLGPINDIYNEAVANTTATMDTDPKTLAEREAWMGAHAGRFVALVAEAPVSGVVGWASLSRWSDRPAYDGTGESSVYVGSSFRGNGIGRKLMEALLEEADRNAFHVVLARITTDNTVSIGLHERLGFERVGVMREVGFKFGKRHDVLVLQRIGK
jgi:L-amino acid N-acyltransferase YncA